RAYFLIAAIQELKELGQLGDFGSDQLNNFSAAVFSELGNFPGINKIEQEMGEQASAIPAERRFSRAIKEEFQATSDRSGVFTDPQYKIRTRMRDVDYYSFSGPTSLGKSFIIKDFVKAAVQKPGMSGSAVVFLVPTNALVAQTASDLRSITSEIQSVNVAIYPTQPRYLVERFSTTIFVFTPERLIRYLNAPSQSIKILIVDEAHKVVAQNDTRAPLYYYAIDRAVRSHATKLFFSSPSIRNPDLLLKLFGTRGGSLVINERVVAQQRFLIDFVEETASYYSNLPSLDRVLLSPSTIKHHDFKAAIEYWASGTKSLVYLNTPSKVVKAALEFAQGRNAVSSSRINKLIAKIKEEIHPEYFLIDVLRKGLAFHHGKMPVSIREEIESAFKDRDSGIDLLVCTSTLLEGVNLPAKNLFILTDRQGDGSKPLGKIDFENLAGRAGRLAQDYSGNVVCVRIKDTNWEAPASQIPNQGPSRADSFIVDPESAEKWRYTDLEKILNGQALPKKRNLTQRDIAEKYATVMLIQAQNSQPSLLFQNFNKKVKNGGHKIENVVKELGIDSRVIEESPEISPRVQDRAFGGLPRQDTDAVILQTSSELDANSIYSLLQ
ncbi:MAG: DEAD/DEAH box helicase, partial [Alteromonadaceae bacterium]|nr:DEAD/DEAH box helicase [Alteromonadaceae bacterium]